MTFPHELPADLVKRVNAEMEALAAHLDEKGIDYEIVEEGDLRLVEWDTDDPAANAAAEQFLKDNVFDLPFLFEDERFCEDGDGDDEAAEENGRHGLAARLDRPARGAASRSPRGVVEPIR